MSPILNVCRQWKVFVILAMTFLSLFLISLLSGFKISPPPTIQSATFYSPSHILRSYSSNDRSAIDLYQTTETSRVGIWQKPTLAILLFAHSLLVIYFLIKTRPSPEEER